jgi:hypothetical protein
LDVPNGAAIARRRAHEFLPSCTILNTCLYKGEHPAPSIVPKKDMELTGRTAVFIRDAELSWLRPK